jgi:hypothetical protein
VWVDQCVMWDSFLCVCVWVNDFVVLCSTPVFALLCSTFSEMESRERVLGNSHCELSSSPTDRAFGTALLVFVL